MSDEQEKKIFARNLNDLLYKNSKTQKEVAQAIGVLTTTFNSWCKGVSLPRMSKVQMLADYFHVSKSDLIEDKSSSFMTAIDTLPSVRPGIERKMIPVLGQISAGLPLYAEENIEYYISTDVVGDGEYFALKVKGDSMNAARIYEGDVLIVRQQDIVEDNDIAVVLVNGDEATVKRWHRDGKYVILIPQSTNPAHTTQIYDPEQVNIKVLGKVVRSLVEFE